jgi:hypothetical protein
MTCPDLIAYYAPPDGVTVGHSVVDTCLTADDYAKAIAFLEYVSMIGQLELTMYPPPDWPRDFWGTP